MDGSKAATPTTAASVERDAGSSSILKLTLCAEAFTDPKDKYSINQHWLTDINADILIIWEGKSWTPGCYQEEEEEEEEINQSFWWSGLDMRNITQEKKSSLNQLQTAVERLFFNINYGEPLNKLISKLNTFQTP